MFEGPTGTWVPWRIVLVVGRPLREPADTPKPAGTGAIVRASRPPIPFSKDKCQCPTWTTPTGVSPISGSTTKRKQLVFDHLYDHPSHGPIREHLEETSIELLATMDHPFVAESDDGENAFYRLTSAAEDALDQNLALVGAPTTWVCRRLVPRLCRGRDGRSDPAVLTAGRLAGALPVVSAAVDAMSAALVPTTLAVTNPVLPRATASSSSRRPLRGQRHDRPRDYLSDLRGRRVYQPRHRPLRQPHLLSGL